MNLRHEGLAIPALEGKICEECAASLLCFTRQGVQVAYCSRCRSVIRVYCCQGGGWFEDTDRFSGGVAQDIVDCGQVAPEIETPESLLIRYTCTTFESATVCDACLSGDTS
jgi:hypothetical protein